VKLLIALAALAAAFALAAPAEAAKRKSASAQKPAVAQADPTAVYDYQGQLIGRDPDPNIRAMMRKDSRPWEGTN
jgi:hypothetical protein